MRFIPLLAAVVLAGCISPTSPDAVTGKPFELKAGASATLPDGARITFDKVAADSRCPLDATCIWAGDATVAVSIVRAGRTEPRELHTFSANGSQIPTANYIITLSGLAPYPRSDRQIGAADYVATLIVSLQ